MFFANIETKLKGYRSKDNLIEQPGRDVGKIMDDFTNKYNPDKILSNGTLSDERKIFQLGILVENYYIDQHKAEIETYKNHMKSVKEGDTETINWLQKKIDKESSEIKSHEKTIELYKKLDSTLAETGG